MCPVLIDYLPKKIGEHRTDKEKLILIFGKKRIKSFKKCPNPLLAILDALLIESRQYTQEDLKISVRYYIKEGKLYDDMEKKFIDYQNIDEDNILLYLDDFIIKVYDLKYKEEIKNNKIKEKLKRFI